MTKRLSVFIFTAIITLAGSHGSVSADTLGEHHTFFVNQSYDATGRTSISATLEYVSAHAYFYVDDSYADNLSPYQRRAFDQVVVNAAQDFDTNIYPQETAFWGSEPNPGVDNDPRLTILLEKLTTNTGGYFDSVNEYTPAQTPHTNQREMIVASIQSLIDNEFSTFLSHEFQHLISFNQKENIHGVSEDTWLNELRSQYSITLTGYNNDYPNSDLSQRVSDFMQNPTDSLTEWPNSLTDYSSVTLFGQYLVDRFGPGILQDSLHSATVSIPSLSEYLAAHQTEKFGNVFADWVWTDYVNQPGTDFMYKNPNLQTIHIAPTDRRSLSASAPNLISYSLKPWQPTLDQFMTDYTAPANKNIQISWGDPRFEVFYADANTAPRPLRDGEIIPPPTSGNSFMLIPVNESKLQNFGASEAPLPVNLSIQYTDQSPVSSAANTTITDGTLIMHAGTPDIYVVTGPYKRLLPPAVLQFYGLDASKAITVSEAVFQSYMTTNYIRDVNEKKVYAVWPDGTKHWLNMTAQHFTDSHRDWNSIFIVNDLESNYYKIGPDITQ